MKIGGPRYHDGRIGRIPAGGPYKLWVNLKIGGGERAIQSDRFFVGDLWVLAGQSNMEGVGKLIDVTEPDDRGDAPGDGRQVDAGRGARCTGSSTRPTRSTRATQDSALSGRPRTHRTRELGRGGGWACRSP